MAIILAVIGGLLFIVISTPFKQSGLMTGFTQKNPLNISTKAPLPELPIPLREKLQSIPSFITQENSPPLEITFSATELNECIRHFSEFDDLKGKMAVKEITETEVLFDISFPLRARPFSEETPHLNGVMHTIPERKNDEIVLNVTHIDSLEGEVPEGFLNHFQPYRVMAAYSDHPQLGRAMFACSEIKLASDQLTVQLDPVAFKDPKALETSKPKKKERSSGMMLFSFLLVGFLFIVMVKRRNNKSAQALKKQAEQE